MTEPMAAADLERSINTARRAADEAIRITREMPLGEIRTKKHAADVVTAVDTAVERAVRAIVAEELPDHVVVGEEYGGTAGDGPTWYCDPVDGTTNLAAGIPWTSFSLSMAIGDRPLVAVVADPWRREVLSAVAGRGTFLGDTPMRLDAGPETLTGGVVGSEWAGYQPWPGMDGLLAALAERLCTTRVMGSGTLTLAQPSAGRTSGAVIGEFHPEDHLAAALLCQEAGLAVLDESGAQNPFPAAGGIMVARRGVADELYALWTEALSIFLPSTKASR
ncbi:inositol monophosphatase family protein [Microlunatus soli]|uniref:Myo-inositol-1(Or 4)-monophosphatase n=1 Tax=Microlunatus soli TaxID=630515 RepID=A0A1H1Y8C5_9ACTN|nr:inositol monophosphatase [Microlunatus soli]SDT17644.1 myo-inositol-1(or 4)-monophosphatase [Microlunatus soli]